MEIINDLIRRYGLEEDIEHIIIPYRDSKGRLNRCFLLKRRFLRIMQQDGHYVDYPMEEVIEAVVRHPGLLVSESLKLFHDELEEQLSRMFGEDKKLADR